MLKGKQRTAANQEWHNQHTVCACLKKKHKKRQYHASLLAVFSRMESLTEPLGAHRSNQSDGTYPRTQWATLLGTVFNLLWLNTTVWKKVEREAVGARRAAGLSILSDPSGFSPHAAHLWGLTGNDAEKISSPVEQNALLMSRGQRSLSGQHAQPRSGVGVPE